MDLYGAHQDDYRYRYTVATRVSDPDPDPDGSAFNLGLEPDPDSESGFRIQMSKNRFKKPKFTMTDFKLKNRKMLRLS
jgi:hypothetical protein